MRHRFYNHKKAVKYCKRNIFLLKALYSAAIPLLVAELIGVAAGVPLTVLLLSGGRFFGLVIAVVIVNSIVIFPALITLVIYKHITVFCVADIVTALNGSRISILRELNQKGACADGLTEAEVLELVRLLIDNGHIKDSRILRGALLVKSDMQLSEKEIDGYLGFRTTGISKKSAAKKIVYELPETEADEFCDNCGKAFEKDGSFCGNCGTMRKDVRRRI